jgi:radical SAM protein with 4Fe4S-binding SPASM domain
MPSDPESPTGDRPTTGAESTARPPRPKYELELENFVALTLDLAKGELEWKSRPYYLEYSTNSACNLRCIMCSQVEDPPVVSTPLELQEPFLDEMGRHVTVMTPSATSEPLLNNMKRLLPIFERHGIMLDIITNGVLLTPEVTEALLPRLHRLTLSIDSHKKEVFELLRAPANFEEVVANSRPAVQRCGEMGIPVIFHMVLARQCLDSLEDYVDFVADMGGKRITVLEMLPNSPQFEDLDPFSTHGEAHVAERLEAMRARAEERRIGVLFEVHAPLGADHDYASPAVRVQSGAILDMMHTELAAQHVGFCPQVMGYFKVEPDGTAYPCCRAPHELELGNVFEDGVEGVWNGPAMQDLRRRMFSRDYPEPCKGCVVLDPPRWRAEERAAEREG